MVEVEAITVEFGDSGCGDEHAGRVGKLDNVKGEGQSGAEGGREAVVRWGVESEQVYERSGACADNGACGGF